MRHFGEALAAKHAHWFELFKGKKYSLGSFMSAIYFKLERQFLDRMIAAIPEPAKVLSYEHDGLGVQLNGLSEASLLAALNDLDPLLQVTIKAPHDPLKLAKEQFPDEEWETASSLPFDAAELHRALLVTRRCMRAPMEAGRAGLGWAGLGWAGLAGLGGLALAWRGLGLGWVGLAGKQLGGWASG